MINYIKAHDLIVGIGTADDNIAIIASSTNCSLDVSSELVECASNNGYWREFVTGVNDWGVSVDGLLQQSHTTSLLRLQMSRTKLFLSFKIGEETFKGEAYIESCRMSGGTSGKGRWNVSLRGNGALT